MLDIKDSVAVITGGASGIGRLVDPMEVASLAGELYRNEALAGDVFFIHGGLRLGSKG
jgi:3-oxoacyl-[acyl-carrier protein] reductase